MRRARFGQFFDRRAVIVSSIMCEWRYRRPEVSVAGYRFAHNHVARGVIPPDRMCSVEILKCAAGSGLGLARTLTIMRTECL